MAIQKTRKKSHNYPEKRKKKKKHIQLMALFRVTDKWLISPDYFYMFFIDGEWWACQQEASFYGHININGQFYKKYFPAEFYDGQNGDVVVGYMGVIYYRDMAIHKGRFVFVKNSFIAGGELSKGLSFKVKDWFDNYKKNEIWKK